MQRHLAVFYLLFVSILNACVTPTETGSPTTSADLYRNSESLFWQIERGGEQHFLMGTMHLGVRLQDLPPKLFQHLSQAEVFVGEVASFQIQQQLIRRYSFLPEGKKLADLIGDEAVDRFIEILQTHDFPFQRQMVERLSLYGVYSTLLVISGRRSVKQANERAKQGQTNSDRKAQTTARAQSDLDILQVDRMPGPLDQKLSILARRQGKAIKGFETLEDQLKMFEVLCTADKVQDMIDNFDATANMVSDLSQSYQRSHTAQSRRGDFADRMVAILNTMSPRERSILLYQRNQRWMKEFARLTQNGRTFIAVGAGHIPGKQGLVSLLRQEGYKVTPIHFE
jgi:hypothetical protein